LLRLIGPQCSEYAPAAKRPIWVRVCELRRLAADTTTAFARVIGALSAELRAMIDDDRPNSSH
jgi:hypothetical protein